MWEIERPRRRRCTGKQIATSDRHGCDQSDTPIAEG